jgi:hypothetical protein
MIVIMMVIIIINNGKGTIMRNGEDRELSEGKKERQKDTAKRTPSLSLFT